VPGPLANFTFTNACLGSPVQFTDLSSVNGGPDINTWLWNFGDASSGGSNTSTLQNPSHIFANPGTYTVSLTVTNIQGCSNTLTQDIVVDPVPQVDFSIADDIICLGENAVFTGIGSFSSWFWNFGDGNTSTQQSPVHLYQLPGIYTVTLTASTTDGCISTVSHDIEVKQLPTADFDVTSTACLIDPIDFTDLSYSPNGQISQWIWDFGDVSAPVTIIAPDDPNISYTYTSGGNYVVSLTITDETGCQNTTSRSIQVVSNPIADFSYVDACFGSPVQFTDLSSANGGPDLNTWEWDFGDLSSGGNNTSTLQNPSHIFTNPGTYTVSLTVTNTQGCSDIISTDIIINALPTVDFTIDNNTVCFGDFAQFEGIGANIVNWSWDFGDGGTATGQTQSYLYDQTGTYTVTLTGTDIDGCVNSVSKEVSIIENPIAAFSFTSGCAADPVYFTDESISNAGLIIAWSWDFGDGGTSDIQNPDHLYANSGVYNVVLEVTDEFGCVNSVTQAIEVVPAPIADFLFNEYCFGDSTEFFDNSATNGGSSITSWLWNFGDLGSGSNNISDLPNPLHAFTSDGTFAVTLIVSNEDGCTDMITKDVVVEPLPEVDFTISDNPVCQGEPVTFSGSSTGITNVAFWSWDFGDGGTSDIQNPIYAYSTPGTYPVTLTGSDADGCQSVAVSYEIHVRERPTADFDFNNVCLGDTIQFLDQSIANEGFINAWIWDFGDGSPTSDLQNPIHSYVLAGNYPVTLIAFDDFGCSDTIIQLVETYANPNADYLFSETCLGDSVYFTDNSNTNGGSAIISWFWDFKDDLSGVNNYSTLQNPSHLFTAHGTYPVLLIVGNEEGCIDSAIYDVVIDTLPDIDFTIANDSICLWEIAEFFSSGTNIASWYWEFGDGEFSNNANPIHLYTQPGLYTVTLIGTDADGCQGVVSHNIYVRENPIAEFEYNNTCYGDSIYFFDQSFSNQSAIISWNWDFGDGNTDTVQNPVHQYQFSGVYLVSLIIVNDLGCSDTTINEVQIFDVPRAAFSFNVECDTAGQVSFFDESQAGNDSPIDSWIWDFGDGYSSNEINPLHIYNFVDSCYSVILTVTDTNGCVARDTNLVCARGRLTLDYTASEVCFGEATFFDADFLPTNDTIVYFRWDFGNGTPFYTSPNDTVSYTYANPGTYQVVLSALDIYGCTASYIDTITVNELPTPDFTYIMSTCEEPTQFIDESDGIVSNITTWSWDFGDYTSGTNNYSNLQNPLHTYPPDDSTYQVKLIVTNINGCVDSIIKTIIRTPCIEAEIYLEDNIICAGSEVCFADSSIIYSNYMSIGLWEWDFGDGNTLTYDYSQNPICHTYDMSGTYEARLIVTAQSGQNILTDTAFQTVVVGPIPIANFGVTGPTCFESLTYFTDLSDGNGTEIDQWSWDFGDDTNPDDTSSLQNPTYTYPAAGIYDVQLIVTSIYGCTDTITNSIEIFALPEANFSNSVGCVDIETYFFDESIEANAPIESWFWNFGNLSSVIDTSDLQNPVYIYSEKGTYNVSLIITDNNMCSDTVDYDVEVFDRPIAAFEINENFENQQGSVYLNNVSQGGSTYYWDFGNGETSEEENPVVQYSEDGIYTITLIAYNDEGCPDSVSIEYELMFKTLYVPNAFAPGNLGWNYEEGRFIVKGVNLYRYHLYIYDAWGDLIWETDALIDGKPAASWNGRNENNPNLDLCPAGAYTWKIDAVFKDGTKWKGSDNGDGNTNPYGTVLLIR